MFGEIDDDEIRLEDERLDDIHRFLNQSADRQFLEAVHTPRSVQTVVREVERRFWNDVRLDELEEGEDREYLYVFEEGPVYYDEPRWLQNNEEIPSRVLDRYFRLVEQSSLPEDLKKTLMMTLSPPQTIDWKSEGF